MNSYESLEEQVPPLSFWPSNMALAEQGLCGAKKSLCKGAGANMASRARSRSRASSRTRGRSRNFASGDTRLKRPRSSPDRLTSSLHKRTPSPSSPSLLPTSVPAAPAVLHPMPFNNSSANVFNAVAFYSPIPPSTPLYLIQLPHPAVSSVITKPKKPTDQHKAEGTKKESMKIARHVTRSLLRSVEKAVASRAISLDAATGPQCDFVVSMNYAKRSSSKAIADVASQTSQNIATGQFAETDPDDPSISSDQCEEGRSSGEWVGDMRALRDSHVQLVLRQLEQLRDIERLDRALRRARITRDTRLQRAPPAAECDDPSPARFPRSP